MAKEFDADLNRLTDERPDEWARFLCARLGIPFGPAEVLDTDLATTVQADKLFRIRGPVSAVIHLEFESNPHLGRPAGLLRYNVLVHHGTGLPVHSVVLLLRPKAQSSDLTGEYTLVGADGRPYLTFGYRVLGCGRNRWTPSLPAVSGWPPWYSVPTSQSATRTESWPGSRRNCGGPGCLVTWKRDWSARPCCSATCGTNTGTWPTSTGDWQ